MPRPNKQQLEERQLLLEQGLRKCSKCKTIKSINNFWKSSVVSDGYDIYCNVCRDSKKHRLANKERYKENNKRYNKKNRYKVTQLIIKRDKERRLEDPLYKHMKKRRWLVPDAIKRKGWKKNTLMYSLLGCDYPTFKHHIESQFDENMNWNNYGEWEVDHIIGLKEAKTIKELDNLLHYTNCQPLWKIDNRIKG